MITCTTEAATVLETMPEYSRTRMFRLIERAANAEKRMQEMRANGICPALQLIDTIY